MRLFAASVLVGMAIAACAGDADAAVICGPTKHVRTVRSTNAVRVFQRHGGSVLACAPGVEKPLSVGFNLRDEDEGWFRVEHIRIAGPYLAAVNACEIGCRMELDENDPVVQVWDVARHRRTYSRALANSAIRVADLEVAADGSVAYVLQSTTIAGRCQLYRGDELIDSGAIEPRSLTIGGDERLYWRRDGALQSAPLHAVESG